MTEPQFAFTDSLPKRKAALLAILVKANAALFTAKIVHHAAEMTNKSQAYSIRYDHTFNRVREEAKTVLANSLWAQGFNVTFHFSSSAEFAPGNAFLAFKITARDLAAEEEARKRQEAQTAKDEAEAKQFEYDQSRLVHFWGESKVGPKGEPTWITVDDFNGYARILCAFPYEFKVWHDYGWHTVLGVYHNHDNKRGWADVVLSNPFGYGVPWKTIKMFYTDRIAVLECSKVYTKLPFHYRFYNMCDYTVELLDWVEFKPRNLNAVTNAYEIGHIRVDEDYEEESHGDKPAQYVPRITVTINGRSGYNPLEASEFSEKVYQLSVRANLLQKFARPRIVPK